MYLFERFFWYTALKRAFPAFFCPAKPTKKKQKTHAVSMQILDIWDNQTLVFVSRL